MLMTLSTGKVSASSGNVPNDEDNRVNDSEAGGGPYFIHVYLSQSFLV